jgi:hypothetical protein
VRISIVPLAALCLAVAPAWAATYDVYDDFSGSQNGVWTYGYAQPAGLGTLSASMILHPTYTSGCVSGNANCWAGASSSAVAPSTTFTSGTVQFQAGYVTMHPGANLDLSVIAFIAPTAANYTFTGEFRDGDTVGGNGVEVASVLGDGTQLLSPTSLPSIFNPLGINFTRSLSAGEAVYFTVGASGEYSYDSVGLRLSVADDLGAVPEPSTWVLTATGSVAAIACRLRRRQSNQ